MESDFYQFKARLINGNELSMNNYKGKVVLVVNTASECGFTPQFEGLEKLYENYKDKGFTILGFPCNQFGNQEPGSDKDIAEGCVINYGVTFPMFSKIEVNGDNAHPIFKFLKNSLPGILGKQIKWNFAKFLINSEGIPVNRFLPSTTPDQLEKYVEKLLESGS